MPRLVRHQSAIRHAIENAPISPDGWVQVPIEDVPGVNWTAGLEELRLQPLTPLIAGAQDSESRHVAVRRLSFQERLPLRDSEALAQSAALFRFSGAPVGLVLFALRGEVAKAFSPESAAQP
jgi:hypothetical protein